MTDNKNTLEDLDATPEGKRPSKIAADIWEVDPVRRDADGIQRPQVWVDRSDTGTGTDNFKARLDGFGVMGVAESSDKKAPENEGWTPVHAVDCVPVLQNAEYRYDMWGSGKLVYENGEHVYENMYTALVKAKALEKYGVPPHGQVVDSFCSCRMSSN